MKYLVLILALLSLGPVKADPILFDEPVVIITKAEFTAMSAEVKKLYDAYKTLEAAKSCKKT